MSDLSLFPKNIVNIALNAQAAYEYAATIPVSIILAQWAIESGFGKHLPGNSNNPFGIKARNGEPFVEAMTHEFINGCSRKMMQRFRKFDSLQEAFDAHAELLATGKMYAQARKSLPDAEKFAHALTGVYATDPNYGMVLVDTMRRYNLFAFDALDKDTFHDALGVKSIQESLLSLGYNCGPVDGVYGPITRNAVQDFIERHRDAFPESEKGISFIKKLCHLVYTNPSNKGIKINAC